MPGRSKRMGACIISDIDIPIVILISQVRVSTQLYLPVD